MSITFDPRKWVYVVSGTGNTYSTLEEAQKADKSAAGVNNPLAGYDATTNTFHPTDPVVSHRVQTQSPSGQVFSAPETVMTDILPTFEQAPSLAALHSAGSSSSSGSHSFSQPAFAGQPVYTGQGNHTGPTPPPFDPLAALPDVMSKINDTVRGPSAGMGAGEGAARAAAFARAKDQIASIGRASLNTLRNMYAGRGMNVAGGDNPLLAREEANVGQNASGALGDVTREQLIQDLNRAREIGDRDAGVQSSYSGQKVGLAESILSMLQARSRGY